MDISYVKRIRELREDNDKTQQEIAYILGTSQTKNKNAFSDIKAMLKALPFFLKIESGMSIVVLYALHNIFRYFFVKFLLLLKTEAAGDKLPPYI